MTNKELIDRIIENDDEHAFSLFFKRIYVRLLKFSFYYVKNHHTAEDVVSEVFINFLKRKTTLTPIINVEAFFYTSVRNQSLKYIQKNKCAGSLSSWSDLKDFEIASNSRPDQEMMDQELFNTISKAVKKLPMQRLMIYEMIKQDQLKYKEVAEIFKISPKTVEKHMSLALKVVREAVRDYLDSKDIKVKKIRNTFNYS